MRIEITHSGIYNQNGKPVAVGTQLDVPDDFTQWANKYRVVSDTQTNSLEPATPVTYREVDEDAEVAVEENDDLESARAEYEAHFGERPHARMKADTIRARLSENEDA